MTTSRDERHKQREPGGTWVFRPRSSAVFAGVIGVMLVSWLWSMLAAGVLDPLSTLPWVAFVAVAGYVTFVRPKVVVDDDGVTLVNPVYTAFVPWAALVHVTTQYALTLHTPHRRVTAWAAPGPGRHVASVSTAVDARSVTRTGGRTGDLGLGDLPGAPSGVAAHQVRERWQHLVEAGAIEAGVAEEIPVTTSIAWPWLAALAALALIGFATALLG